MTSLLSKMRDFRISIKDAIDITLPEADLESSFTEKRFIQSFRQLNKLNLFLTVFITFIFRIIPLMRTFAFSAVSDDVGTLFLAVRLAGFNWSDMSTDFHFYGQGYYAFFAPIFMLTDNPYIIWLSIILINIILVSIFSIVIYAIAVIYCRLPDKIPTILIVVFFSIFSGAGRLTRNEVPIYFIVWLVALILFISINSNKKKTKIFSTLLLVFILTYGMFIHARLEVLIIIISLVVFLYFICFKFWIVSPVIYYPSIILGYFFSRFINQYLANILYGGRDFTSVGNAALITNRVVTSVNNVSIEPFIDAMVSNIYAFFISTKGLSAITIVFLGMLFFRTIKRLFIERIRSDEGVGLPRDQYAVAIVFAGCLFSSIIGVYLIGRLFIESLYVGGGVSRWMVYTRYFQIYFAPLCLIMISYSYHNKQKMIKICLASLSLFIMFHIYMVNKIIPLINHTHDYIRTDAFNIYLRSFDGALMNSYGSFILMLCLFFVYYLLIKKNSLLLTLPFILLSLSISISGIAMPFFNITAPSERAERLFSIFRHIDDTSELPDIIYTGNRRDVELQIMLNRKTITRGFPEYENEQSILVGNVCNYSSLYLLNRGFCVFRFPNNIRIWTNCNDLQESLKIYAHENNFDTRISDPLLLYLIESANVNRIYMYNIDDIWIYQHTFQYKQFYQLYSFENISYKNLNDIMILGNYDGFFTSYSHAALDDYIIITDNEPVQLHLRNLGAWSVYIPIN